MSKVLFHASATSGVYCFPNAWRRTSNITSFKFWKSGKQRLVKKRIFFPSYYHIFYIYSHIYIYIFVISSLLFQISRYKKKEKKMVTKYSTNIRWYLREREIVIEKCSILILHSVMKVKSNLFSLVIYIYLARFSNFHSRTWNSSFVWPRFLCLSTKPIRLASINPGSCKKSITLFKAVITLAQWAWNRLLAGNSFKGVSMKAVKYRWYSGYFLKNLKFVIRWNVGINRSSGGRGKNRRI